MSAPRMTYQQALEELQQMFPEVDKEIVVMLLKDNGGHLEKTIDNLLVIKGEQPINEDAFAADQEQAEQVALDEAIARDLERTMAIRDAIAMIEAEQRGGGAAAAYDARGGAEEGDDELTFKDLKEKIGKLSTSAKLKLKTVWSRIKPKAAAGATSGGPATATGGQGGGDRRQQYSRLINDNPAVTGNDDDDDDEQVAFDSSLSRRIRAAPGDDDSAAGDGGIPLQAMSSLRRSSAGSATTTTTTTVTTSGGGSGSGGNSGPVLARLVDLDESPAAESKKDK